MEPLRRTKKKHTQCDYNLGFKLAVISQDEKGEMTYKQVKINSAFNDEVLHWFGYEYIVT